MADVLIIDDDLMVCGTLSRHAEMRGHRASSALTLKEGLEKAFAEPCDVVFLDVNLPDGSGLEAITKLRKSPSSPEIIIITGVGEPDGAELAIRSGAWDYMQKPFAKGDVYLQLVRVLQYREEKGRTRVPVVLKREGIIGHSPLINACLDLVARSAQSDANVLITGETGTGKEIFARAIHDNSPRASENFVVVDCTVLPEKLVESVLFGHRKGAFTGADRAHDGLIKQADGGTLFLDEVGELPQDIQKTFLRVIQEHSFRPVGSTEEIQSHFRLVAATNRDLDQMVGFGGFRQDLLFRIRSITIELPTLRERLGDIRELTMFHATKICERNGMETKGFSPEFFETLASYDWPGNIRELVNALDQAIVAEPSNPVLFPKHLPDRIRIKVARASIEKRKREPFVSGKSIEPVSALPKLRELRESVLAELEQQYLKDLMSLTKGNIHDACRISGLKRARLYELMKLYDIGKSSQSFS